MVGHDEVPHRVRGSSSDAAAHGSSGGASRGAPGSIRVRSPGCHGFSPPGRGHDLEETCDQPEPLAHRREARNHRAVASGSVPPSPIPADTQSKQSLPRPDRGFASRCPRTNTRVEVRVATPILHIRRQLAGHRFAAHAAGHRPGGHRVCGSAPVDRRAAAHDTWPASVAGSGMLLFAGLWTPVAGAVVALIEVSQIRRVDEDPRVCLLSAGIASGLAMLGPGRWSIDARLFGWKRIEPPSARPRSRVG